MKTNHIIKQIAIIFLVFSLQNIFAQQSMVQTVKGTDGVSTHIRITPTQLIIANNGGGCTFQTKFDYDLFFTDNNGEMLDKYSLYTSQVYIEYKNGQNGFAEIGKKTGSGTNTTSTSSYLGDCSTLTVDNIIDYARIVIEGPNFKLQSADVEWVSPLAIELNDFSATANTNSITLNWETASETNNNFFTIEKSIDGIEWNEVGITRGSGNSSTTMSYSIEDYSPVNGVNYYRLSQTDYDGSSKTFNTISILFKGETSLIIYPNPTTEYITIQNVKENQAIELLSLTGGKIKEWNSQNETTKTISLKDFNKGIYFLKIGDIEKRIVLQ